MGRYTKIISDMWGDREFDEELDIDGKLFYLYLLTNDAGNMAGFYRINPKKASIETGIGIDRINELLESDIGLWEYDPKTRQIFIKSYMKYNDVCNTKQYKGVATQIKPLSFCSLFVDFLAALIKATKGAALPYIPAQTLKLTNAVCEKIISEEATTAKEAKQKARAVTVSNYINTTLQSITDTDTNQYSTVQEYR